MYLTRFRVNTGRAGARRLLSSPQALHAAVLMSFPGGVPAPSGDGPRVLWRLDHNSPAEVLLYLVSPDRPDLTHLVEQAGWPAAAAHDPSDPGWLSRPYIPFLNRLSPGGVWGFRLTANPVHHIRRKDGEQTKRTAHVTAVHQTRWLLDRQEASGFEILEKPAAERLLPDGQTHRGHPHHGDRHQVTVRDLRALAFSKSREDRAARRPQVKVVTATYDGRLRITDPDALRRVLTQGIGKAKAYGCGLMTLAPVPPGTAPA
ncbi:type I-E CRISPR-associated protein Cas6/Cse3/CasE [Streptomyces xiamenensis]